MRCLSAKTLTTFALCASATDTVLTHLHVVFEGQRGRKATPGDVVDWNVASSRNAVFAAEGGVASAASAMAALGVFAIASSTLICEVVQLLWTSPRSTDRLLPQTSLAFIRRASTVSAAWFATLALWLADRSRYPKSILPAPKRNSLRLLSLIGWFASTILVPCFVRTGTSIE